MTGDNPFSFYINFEAVFKAESYKQAKKEMEIILDQMQKKIDEVNKEIDKKNGASMIKFVGHLKKASGVFGNLIRSTSIFVGKINLFSTILGGLAMLKYQGIQDLDENIQSINENSKEVYKYLSDSSKVMGTDTETVREELNNIIKARRDFMTKGITQNLEWQLFGANSGDTAEEILNKFRDKVKNIPEQTAKMLAERMEFDNIYKVAKLSDKEFEKLSSTSVYTQKNLERMRKAAAETKKLTGFAKDFKDSLIVSFFFIVVGILKTISAVLNSSVIQGLFNIIQEAVDTFIEFDKLLGGIPFKIIAHY